MRRTNVPPDSNADYDLAAYTFCLKRHRHTGGGGLEYLHLALRVVEGDKN
jgi:hypothetical protein